MQIDIAKKDLQILRDVLRYTVERAGRNNPILFHKEIVVTLKTIKKVNLALKKVHGHDCHGKYYLDTENYKRGIIPLDCKETPKLEEDDENRHE